jgi:hypothetical protein
MNMSTPVRYPSGVTNVKPSDALANFPMPAFTRVYYDFDDFMFFGLHGQASTEFDWITTSVGADSTLLKNNSVAGGVISMVLGTADNSGWTMARNTEAFALETGRRAWFGIRARVNTEVTEMDFFFGLGSSSTGPIATTVINRVGFKKDDGDTNVDFAGTAAGTAVLTAAAIDTLVAAAWVTYEFEFDGVSAFKYFINGVHTGTVSSASFPTENMALTIAALNGSLGTLATRATVDIDWVYAAKERTSVND